MSRYKIFAGLGGDFGGAEFQYISEDITEKEAMTEAYELACNIYESHEGLGIDGYEEFLQEAEANISLEDFEDKDEYENAIEKYCDELSAEARESWIDYYVERIKE